MLTAAFLLAAGAATLAGQHAPPPRSGLSGRPDARSGPVQGQPLEGRVKEWAIPLPNALPHDPAVDPAGNVWVTLMRANQLARFDPQSEKWKLYPVPTPHAGPHGLVADSTGTIWFTENFAGKIARLDPSSGPETAKIEEHTLPFQDARPRRLVTDGHALYFTDFRGGRLGRLDLRTMRFQFWPSPSGPDAAPYGIGVGGDGNIWYNEVRANQMIEFDPRTRKFMSFPLASPHAQIRNIARDASGRLWLAMSGADKLAVLY
jgi:virginiamycin B lyase